MNTGRTVCGKLPQIRMDREEDALSYYDLPKEKKVILGEDAQQELDKRLKLLVPGDLVRAEYYLFRRYVFFSGEFERVDTLRNSLIISGKRIPLDQLRNIYREDWI